MDAATIADTIINKSNQFGLNLENLHGQGYDGCSAMAGKENGVQARIRNTYSKAVSCTAHLID
ncbi:hypothetical protein HOLleu_15457 [Holothuria leucospilota]|uniref:Uncharacterized protein n=1 Tax=Holothuria leucospilota TaxID=206669 RepID=A0A9Q1CAG7_HOLLE|nr:hypothetical protein HOLleu_15457 [Holothuria leucospilota]